jgi:hypothetical protein
VRFFDSKEMRELEARLRAARPEPGAQLIHSIVGRAGPVARGRSLRLVFAVVSAAAVAGLAYVGGVSYASSSAKHAATSAWSAFSFQSSTSSDKQRGPTTNNSTRNRGDNGDDDDDDDDDDLCDKSAKCEYEDDDDNGNDVKKACKKDETARHKDAIEAIKLINNDQRRKAARKAENELHEQNEKACNRR